MDAVKEAYNTLIKGIQNYVDLAITKGTDKTYSAIIQAVDSTENEYTVLLNNVSYSGVSTIGGTCEVNEVVHVLVPQGNFSNMFILK